MNLDLIFSIITSVGSLATVGSLIWAISVYKNSRREKELLDARKAIMSFPEHCKTIDRLLSEAVFSAIGYGVADELEKMMPDNQTLEDFTNEFMLSPETDNYKTLAIYMGMKKCSEVDEIARNINYVEECHRNIVPLFPLLGKSFNDIAFYVTLPAEKAITTRILNMNLKYIVDGEENEGLKVMLSEALATGTKELYFKRIALHLTKSISANLDRSRYGQAGITLAQKMLKILAKRFETMSNSELIKASTVDLKNAQNIQSISDSQEYAIQSAMELLKIHKKLYSDKEWEKLIENKGRILQLSRDE